MMKRQIGYIAKRVLVGVLISLILGAIYEARAAGYIEDGRPDVGLRGLKYKYGANSRVYREAVATARIRSTAVGGTRYVSKSLGLSNRSVAGMARAAGKVGLRMNLFTAAGLAALDWYFGDPDGPGPFERDFYKDRNGDGEPDQKPIQCDQSWRISSGSTEYFGCSPESVASQYIKARTGHFVRNPALTGCGVEGSTTWCNYTYQDSQRNDKTGRVNPRQFDGSHTEEGTEPELVTNDELAERIASSPDAVQRLLDGALRDPTILDEYNETQDWLRDLRDNIERHENGDPDAPLLPEISDGSNENPFSPDNYTEEYRDSLADIRDQGRDSNEYLRDIRDTNREIRDSLQQPDNDPGNEDQPQNEPREQLTDCDLYQPGCTIRDWLMEDPEAPAPGDNNGDGTVDAADDPQPDTKTLGIGDFEVDNRLEGGACPAPMTATVQGQTIEVGWTPVCDFMELTRPGIVAGAWLFALIIVGGAGRKR